MKTEEWRMGVFWTPSKQKSATPSK